MGTKISALTETGSAPAGSYLPLAYDGENYKITPANAVSSAAGGGAGNSILVAGGTDFPGTYDRPLPLYSGAYLSTETPWEPSGLPTGSPHVGSRWTIWEDNAGSDIKVYDSISGKTASGAGWGQAMSGVATLKATNRTVIEGDMAYFANDNTFSNVCGNITVKVDWANDKVVGTFLVSNRQTVWWSATLHDSPLAATHVFDTGTYFRAAYPPALGLDLVNKTITGLPLGQTRGWDGYYYGAFAHYKVTLE